MRLDFNVLWVDDQPALLKPQISGISLRMREQGFELKPKVVSSRADAVALIADDIFRDEIDLILVDWDLGGEEKGQDVIYEIRSEVQYKDVIFYSSLTSVTELREAAYKVGAEGVYCASKTNIVDEVMGVFEALVKKVLDLDHTRGIVMGATSDIDRMVHECLGAIHGAGGGGERKYLLSRAKKIIGERIAALTARAKELENAESVEELLKAHALFGASDRLRVLKGILEAKEYDSQIELRQSLGSYIEKVLPLRNELGHLVLTPEGATGLLAEAVGRSVGLEEMRLLRVSLLKLREEMREFATGLSRT